MSKKKPGADDPFATDKWHGYADRFRKDVLPMIAATAHVLCLTPEKNSDIKFMLEVGAAICLDKPLVLLVTPGRTIPPRLARVADKIIEADLSTDAGRKAASQQLMEYLHQ